MSKQQQSCVIFLFGFYGYSLIEILWRGHTHWSMALTGGSCFMLLYRFFNQFPLQKLWKKCVSAAGLVTCVEYFVGCIVNGVLNLREMCIRDRDMVALGTGPKISLSPDNVVQHIIRVDSRPPGVQVRAVLNPAAGNGQCGIVLHCLTS